MIGSLPAVGYYNQSVGGPSATAYQSLSAYPTALFGPPVSQQSYGSYGSSYGVQAYGQLNGYLGSYGSSYPSYTYAQTQYGYPTQAQPQYSFPVQPYQPTYNYSPVTDTYNSQQLWNNQYLTNNTNVYQNNYYQYGNQTTGYPPVSQPCPPPPPPTSPPSPPIYDHPTPPPTPPTPPPCPPPPDPPANTYHPTTPATSKPGLDGWASFEDGHVNYPPLNNLDSITDYESAAQTLDLRLIGGEQCDRDRFYNNGQDPRGNADGNAAERMAVYNTLESNPRLRYNLDTNKFVTTFPDGSTRPVCTLDDIQCLPEGTDLKQHMADQLACVDAKFPPYFPNGGRVPAGADRNTNPLGGTASFEDGAVHYPPLNDLNTITDYESAAQTLDTRLVGGDPEKRTMFYFNGQDPRSNTDGKMAERMAVYDALKSNDRLRFDLDHNTFVLTYPDGSTRAIDSLAHVMNECHTGGTSLEDHLASLIAQTDQQVPPWTFGANRTPRPYAQRNA